MKNQCKEYIPKLQSMSLFYGIKETEMQSILNCLGAYVKEYQKEQYIFSREDNIDVVGIVLSGTVNMIREDLWGNKTLLVSIRDKELFGETFACGVNKNATVSFLAAENTKVLFLSLCCIMRTCSQVCKFHHRLIENMVMVIAEKNTILMDKVDIISKKTLREKVSTYLLQESGKQGSVYFDIPLGRVQLAEYLCADRSALTRELNKMRKEGLIDFEKNSFRILMSLE